MSYDSWKLRSDRDEDPERPDYHDPDDCPYCEEHERRINQQVEINEALRDSLAVLVSAIKTNWRISNAITDAEVLLGVKP